MSNEKDEKQEVHNLKNMESGERVFLLSMETQINTLSDLVSQSQSDSNKALENLKSLHLILSSIPQKMSDQLLGSTPGIIAALKKELTEEVNKAHFSYVKNIAAYDDYLHSAQEKLELLNSSLFKIESKRILRFFLGVTISSVIAITSSLYASSYMIKQFPTRVTVNSPENVHLNESEIRFRQVGGTKVRRTNQKK